MTLSNLPKAAVKFTWLLILPLLLSLNPMSTDLPSITLSQRQLCDLELLLNGGFAPLTGFMDQPTYDAVVHSMRLSNGRLWPMPIVLDIEEKTKNKLANFDQLILRDPEGTIMALLKVSQIWKPDKTVEAGKVYGTTNSEHPGVDYLFNQTGEYYVGGELVKLAQPKHYDFLPLRKTPEELKALFKPVIVP